MFTEHFLTLWDPVLFRLILDITRYTRAEILFSADGRYFGLVIFFPSTSTSHRSADKNKLLAAQFKFLNIWMLNSEAL